MSDLKRPYLWLLVPQRTQIVLSAHKFEDRETMITAMHAFGPQAEYYASTETEYREFIARSRNGAAVKHNGYWFNPLSVEEGEGAVMIRMAVPENLQRRWRMKR